MKNKWALVITFCDVENNRFLELGGAAWPTKRERDAQLARIPHGPEESNLILDVKRGYDTVDDRCLSAATVEGLMGKPLSVLIAEANLRGGPHA